MVSSCPTTCRVSSTHQTCEPADPASLTSSDCGSCTVETTDKGISCLSCGGCPTGTCDPGCSNGLGIYVAERGNYCFGAPEHPDERSVRRGGAFCPEAFVNRELEGKQTVMLRGLAWPGWTPVELPVSAVHGDVVKAVRSARIKDGNFQLTLDDDSFFSGVSISQVELRVGANPNAPAYRLGFGEHELGVTSRYRVQYTGADGPKPLCAGPYPNSPPARTAFLPGRAVDGWNAYVTEEPNVVTMACETGAIVTCSQVWGYVPWNTGKGQPDTMLETIYASCLQAKRAAYFVEAGHLRSYTRSGIEVRRRDQLNIKADVIEDVEAVWGPQGAECITPENNRLKDPQLASQLQELATKYGVPSCKSGEGTLVTGPFP
nr:ADYC domain-containing protein [Pyxidicoccus fallax]